MKANAWQKGKLVVLALVVLVVAAAVWRPRPSSPSWLARWRKPVTAPPRLSVRAGIRVVALRSPSCVRAGPLAVGG